MSVQVELQDAGLLKRAENLLGSIPEESERAARSATARAAAHLRTNSAKAIRQRYDIAAGQVKANQRVSIRYSTQNGLQAEVKFAGGRIPLYKYGGAGPSGPQVDGSRLVPVMIRGQWRMAHPSVAGRGHQLNSTAAVTFEHAFVARMKSGHVGLFERSGEKLSEIMGGSVLGMLGNQEVSEWLAQEAAEKWAQRYEHEILARLNGWV